MIKITVLADNIVDRAGLIAEHGLALLVQTEDKNILFDTGQGHAIENNMKVLGLDKIEIDKVILSHGHYDHSKGLTDALPRIFGKKLYCHGNIETKHLRKSDDGDHKFIGLAKSVNELSKHYHVEINHDPVCIYDNLHLSGTVKRYTDFDSDQLLLCEHDEGLSKDMFIDEQHLTIDDKDGLVVITGCSHCGIINVIEHTKEHFPGKHIKAVIGGFHLFRANENEIDQVIEYLNENRIDKVLTGHCTGFDASFRLKLKLGDRADILKVGAVFEL